MEFRKRVFLELLDNGLFIKWLIAPDKESDRYWQQWISENPDKVPILKEIKAMINAIGLRETFKLDPTEKEEMLEQVLEYGKNKKVRELQFRHEPTTKKSRSGWYFAAACCFLLAILTANYFNVFQPVANVPEIIQGHKVVKSTPKGYKSSFYLPDGSFVKLNSSSSVEFPSSFPDSIRVVRLVGQAFFEVVRNESAPFIVQADNVNVRVLGTSFDVQSYPEAHKLEVAVSEGIVAVDTESGLSETLSQSEMVSLNRETGKMKTSTFSPIYQLGWKDGILAFNDRPLEEVFEELEKWYGVELKTGSKINLNKRFTGIYENQSLENVLTGMSKILGWKFKINGKEVSISN